MTDVAPNLVHDVQFLDHLLSSNSITPPHDSILKEYLEETRRFHSASHQLPAAADIHCWENEMAAIAEKLIIIHRLADAFDRLGKKKAPKLIERLRDISQRLSTNPDQVREFRDLEYETFCGGEFVIGDDRVSFITDSAKHQSRYKKRVEFLINNRFPVECKRPQGRDNIVPIIKSAALKIAERNSKWEGNRPFAPGAVCVCLDHALRAGDCFQQALNEQSFAQSFNKTFQDLVRKYQSSVLAAIAEQSVEVVLFHHHALVYYHENGTLGVPTFAMAMTKDGRWLSPVSQPIPVSCIQKLKNAQPVVHVDAEPSEGGKDRGSKNSERRNS